MKSIVEPQNLSRTCNEALILAVLDGVGRADEARTIRDSAINRVEVESVRTSVRELLSGYGQTG